MAAAGRGIWVGIAFDKSFHVYRWHRNSEAKFRARVEARSNHGSCTEISKIGGKYSGNCLGLPANLYRHSHCTNVQYGSREALPSTGKPCLWIWTQGG